MKLTTNKVQAKNAASNAILVTDKVHPLRVVRDVRVPVSIDMFSLTLISFRTMYANLVVHRATEYQVHQLSDSRLSCCLWWCCSLSSTCLAAIDKGLVLMRGFHIQFVHDDAYFIVLRDNL